MKKQITILFLLISLTMTATTTYAATFPNPPLDERELIGDVIAKKIRLAIINWKHNKKLKLNLQKT